MRNFIKISWDQAQIDNMTEEEYAAIELPTRATINSAGYDFRTVRHVVIPAKSTMPIPTGLRAYMLDDEVLQLYIRSSLGFKRGLRLANSTGIVDADYFYADNEGHIWIGIFNDNEIGIELEAGEKIAQGIFMKYLTTGDVVVKTRTGGLGSTGQ